jgi:hypothetical protein
MTLEEYKAKLEKVEDWAPGWDSIDACLEKIYGNQEPKHYGTDFHARAIYGGDNYLDGYSVFISEHTHLHIVTYGMSKLYADIEAFGGEYSGWGYEMTLKLQNGTEDNYMWAIDVLSNIARYTFKTERYFEPFQFISNNSNSIRAGTDSELKGFLIVNDTELSGRDTVHGRLDFLQLVGITQVELNKITTNREKIAPLIENMKKDNPFLVTDLSRTQNYL